MLIGRGEARRRPRLLLPDRLPLVLLGAVAAGGLLVLLVGLAAHDVAANSDSATVALEGRSVGQGNLTLSGWSLSLDSFWTIDALFYTAAIAALGFIPQLVEVVPAVIAVSVIGLGAVVASERLPARGKVAAIAVVLAFLGLPNHAFATFFLQGPWHVGTTLWCLAAFIALRDGQLGWRSVAAALFLAAGLLGDLQTLGIGVIPVAGAGLLASARRRDWRAGVLLVAVSASSVLIALVVRKLTSWAGAFSYHESHHTAALPQMWSDLGHLGNWSTALLGIRSGPYGGPSVPLPVEAARLLLAVVILVGFVIALGSVVRGAVMGRSDEHGWWRLDDLLLCGCLGDLCLFEVLTLSKNASYARYLTPAVILAVLLAARIVGRQVAATSTPRVRRASLVAALAIAAGLGAGVTLDLETTSAPQPVAPLDAFLIAHHLTVGIGDYWAASVVTLETHGAVTVRPVVADNTGIIVRDGRQSDRVWYEGRRFQFLVYQRAPYGRVSATTVEKTFGQPSATYRIGGYSVLVWPQRIQLPAGEFP